MTHTPAPAFKHTAGSRQPKILLVGEAFGKDEESLGLPFVGESGKELFRILGEALPDIAPELHAEICDLHRYGLAWVRARERWFEAAGIALTNVLALRPPDNKLENLCAKKKEVGGDSYLYPPISKGKYLRPEFLPELARLAEEITALNPNILVALGNTACWAILRATNIGSIRGATAGGAENGVATGRKTIATYHPAGVLRNWSWRPIVVADLMKAGREAQFAEIRRPQRRILIDPTFEEVKGWFAGVLSVLTGRPLLVAADTETEAGQITCISFAPDIGQALVIPFWDKTKPGYSYWAEQWQEEEVWSMIQEFMEHPQIELCWQNGQYDFQYCLPMKLKVHRSTQDTMLLHHSIYPEMQKSLGFLGSYLTDESSWKLMRRWKSDSEKRDE